MNNRDYQQYQNTLTVIKNIMKYEQDLRRVFGNQVQKIKESLTLIENQMEKLAKDESILPSNRDLSLVKKITDLFLSVATERPIVPIFRDLSLNYSLLVFNWNQALGQCPDIERNLRATRAIVTGQMTIVEAIDTLKSLLARAKSFQQYQPPVFELSKHYLQSLKNTEKKKEEEEEDKKSD